MRLMIQGLMIQGSAGFALGVVLLLLWPWLPSWPVCLAPLLPACWLGWRGLWRPALALLGLALGMSWSVQVASRQLAAWLPLACENQPLIVTGRVVGLPEPDDTGRGRFLFQPLTTATCQPADSLWQVSADFAGRMRPGEVWSLQLRLKRPHALSNPGGFDAEKLAHQRGVTATGWARAGQRLAATLDRVDGLRWRLRQALLARFPGQPAAGTVLALLTGDRNGIPPEAWDRYARTGITHLVAISGTHITMVAWLSGWLAARLWLLLPGLALRLPASRVAAVAGLGCATAYGVLAGMELPTQRTLLMLAVFLSARWLPGEWSGSQALLLSLAVVLAFDPLSVHAAGLWLSFMAVGLLMLGGLAPGEESGWRSALRAQWLATWGLMPLTLALFARVSWVALPVNVVAIPWVTFGIVPPAMLGALCLDVWPAATDLCWRLSVWLMTKLDQLLTLFADLPWAAADLSVPGARLPALILMLALLLMPRALPGRWLAVFPALVLCWPQPSLQPGQLRLTVLDVGQGLSVHVQTARHNLLYDTGPAMGAHMDAGSRVILPYLRWQAVKSLDMVMISHDHLDHTGGLATILKALPVARLMGRPPEAVTQGRAVTPCQGGQHWRWDGVDFDVFWPVPEVAPGGENNHSCVLRIRVGGRAILLPGDLEAPGERWLVSTLPTDALRADLLILGHHGSKTSSTETFLDVVRPREVIASCGHRNSYRHPSAPVVERLAARRVTGWRTDRSGALRYEFLQADRFPTVRRWRLTPAHYWAQWPEAAGHPDAGQRDALGALAAFP